MWQHYFCCTSALHLMQSNNVIHITELICPIKIRLRVNYNVAYRTMYAKAAFCLIEAGCI